ncbi:DUF3866 family protein [Anaerobacillus sp. MEB173]|uniref:DUF3866 family protein n=1 Tax=Anaerobacillus sp. MEB173 TaxID=3383345 RepID=UPI003F91C5FB
MYKEMIVRVTEILYEDHQIQLLQTSGGAKRAMLYRSFIAKANIGDTILVNTTAVSLRLGTGGWDIVKTIVSPLKEHSQTQEGHIMKARYLPSQYSVLSVEAQESKDHELFLQPFTLSGKSILIGELHSMIPIAYGVLREIDQNRSMTVIISDQAALPLAMSRHLRFLHNKTNFSSITIGQAFGGQYEAVNLQTALQFATEKLHSDLIMVSLGPGVVGTGTRYGFSGMEQANWANIIGSLSGTPVWIPRLSFSDGRERHKGISHHTLTPLEKFTFVKSVVPLPTLKKDWLTKLQKQVEPLQEKGHQIEFEKQNDLETYIELTIKNYPFPLKTMGREYKDDPSFFLGVAAAVKWVMEHS